MGNATEITLDQARDMIRSIDNRLIPECRDFDTYTETDDIWRIGDYGYVAADVYEQAFRDYEERNGETEWRAQCTCLRATSRTASNTSWKRTISAGCQCWTGFWTPSSTTGTRMRCI